MQGSLDANSSTVNYVNGSVFWKAPGVDLFKIFGFEGYNINRKVRQPDGTFLSLSREFAVYRDPITSDILTVWINPLTEHANEVFLVADDPVNFPVKAAAPSILIPREDPGYIAYNVDYIQETPNPLSPEAYPKYSPGEYYNAVELFGFTANYTYLKMSQEQSIPMVGTWMRKSQLLPWFEVGTTPGSLYYTGLNWKCTDGLSCVADDIMQIVDSEYPKYKNAPTTDEQPNQTSWTVFKKIIDQRRQAGLPDIIIPLVNISTESPTMTYEVDKRVDNILYNTWPIDLNVNGTAWSEIPGQKSVPFFNIIGNVQLDYEPLSVGNGYRIQLDGFVQFFNVTTGILIQNFTNPVTGKANNVSVQNAVEADYIFTKDSFYTVDMPQAKAVGLLGAQSIEGASLSNSEEWTVNMLNFIFPYSELDKGPNAARFHGTWAMFRSWPDWMEMGDIPGNMVIKVTVGFF